MCMYMYMGMLTICMYMYICIWTCLRQLAVNGTSGVLYYVPVASGGRRNNITGVALATGSTVRL